MQATTEVAATQNQSPVQITNVLKTFVSAVAFVLLFLGFILQLGGVGDVHSDCNDEFDSDDCEDTLREYWWATFFQFLLGIAVGVLMLLDVMKDVIHAVSIFLAISTTQLIYAAEFFLDAEDESGPRAAATGYIFSVMANFLLILVIGITDTPKPTAPKLPAIATGTTATQATGSNPTGGSTSAQTQTKLPPSQPAYVPQLSPQVPTFQTRSAMPAYQTQPPRVPSPRQSQPRGGGPVDI